MKLNAANQAQLPKGYAAAGVWSGVKSSRKDLAIFYSQYPASVAGVFTQNVVKGAPVIACQERLHHGVARAIVVNSGIANTCTGEQGLTDADAMAAHAGQTLGIPAEEVYPISTGVIGVLLPMPKIIAGIDTALQQLSFEGFQDAAEAILTTDSRTKIASVSFGPDQMYTVSGVAKGSGMIHPNMATMLGFVFTDAPVNQQTLQGLLKDVTDKTFNMVSVDGDTSTNDTVLALANGAAGGEEIFPDGSLYQQLRAAFLAVSTFLAKEIARDGEGASKLITVRVTGSSSELDARAAARAISASNLVKTAIFGADANWGRILCAAGYSGAQFEQERATVNIMGLTVFQLGRPCNFSEDEATRLLEQPEVEVHIDLGSGSAEATAYTCDFTYDYVKVNASYRS